MDCTVLDGCAVLWVVQCICDRIKSNKLSSCEWLYGVLQAQQRLRTGDVYFVFDRYVEFSVKFYFAMLVICVTSELDYVQYNCCDCRENAWTSFWACLVGLGWRQYDGDGAVIAEMGWGRWQWRWGRWRNCGDGVGWVQDSLVSFSNTAILVSDESDKASTLAILFDNSNSNKTTTVMMMMTITIMKLIGLVDCIAWDDKYLR